MPLAAPDLSGAEEAYVVEAVRSGWLSGQGPFVKRFEREFAAAVGTRYTFAVSSGTAALHLALLALGIGPGDEVLLPSLSFVSTANAVRYVGAEPVFVDVDPASWTIDPADLAAKLTPRARAIMPVHLYGQPADMDAIRAIARKHDLFIVEDAAQAFGARHKGAPAGGLGDIGCFSFYGNKIITSGEGGCVTTNDDALAEKIALYRGQGMDPERRYFFPVIGYNYRPTNLGCALLCAQLERADDILTERRRIFAAYRERLSGLAGIGMQPVTDNADAAPWLFSILIDEARFGMGRDAVMGELQSRGVETRPFFMPIHQLPPYLGSDDAPVANLPVTDRLASQGISLPTFNGIADAQIDYVCEVIAASQARDAAQPNENEQCVSG